MHEIVEALRAQDGELDGLLAGLDDAGWATPTPCEGWDVADVVLHVAQTDEFAVASIGGVVGSLGLSPDVGVGTADDFASVAVERERGLPPAELLERWRAAARAQRDALAACDPKQRLPWVIGELPARTLATTRLSETWIHTTDVARALDQPVEPSPRLWHVARLAWRTLPYAFAREGRELSGPVAVVLDAPGGERWTFGTEDEPATTIRGDALEWCLVAGRRLDPAAAALRGDGADLDAVLSLVRTYA